MHDDRLMVKKENDFDYPIVFRTDFSGLKEETAALHKDYSSVCIVTDTNVAPLYLEETKKEFQKLFDHVSSYTFAAGEQNKHLGTVTDILRHLIAEGMDRSGLLVALGGGVAGDMTGFASAIYLRGIDFMQIPTTLLAQVDSSVGGKTGVDLESYKNMVGAFHQPVLVYMNMNALRTLPYEEFVCGMGEVLKTGLICDGDFYRRTVDNADLLKVFDTAALSDTVRRCCEIKAGIVERDPREKGERALLNLGHTIGHAIEKLKNFTINHGMCVGIGLAAAAAISVKRGTLSQEEYDEIIKGLTSCGLPVSTTGLSASQVLEATKKDKKMKAGQIRFILMQGIGGSYIDRTVTDEELLYGIRRVLE